MKIPYLKAHGAKNDFLLTPVDALPGGAPLPDVARAICDRHTGVGADGWLHVGPGGEGADGEIHLYNADGSVAEISGNGTRCAAAFLIYNGLKATEIRIRTGAGLKYLRLLKRTGLHFTFEMNMGVPQIQAASFSLPLTGGVREAALVWVGNPQCAVPVENFDFDWRKMGAEIESHPHFPNRTNVSFFRARDRHSIEVVFYERGAGETCSSGTGATGAVAAALSRGMVKSPVRVDTPAGPLEIRGNTELFLVGPAAILATGEFYLGE